MPFPSRPDPSHRYFITATLCGWKRLFEQTAYAEIVLQSLRWLRQEQKMFLYAFVLMPSHLHALPNQGNRQLATCCKILVPSQRMPS